MRLKSNPSTLLKAKDIVVFPTPGISSNSTCPPARNVINIFLITVSLPIITFLISLIIRSDLFILSSSVDFHQSFASHLLLNNEYFTINLPYEKCLLFFVYENYELVRLTSMQ